MTMTHETCHGRIALVATRTTHGYQSYEPQTEAQCRDCARLVTPRQSAQVMTAPHLWRIKPQRGVCEDRA